jgi:hypothetical protein
LPISFSCWYVEPSFASFPFLKSFPSTTWVDVSAKLIVMGGFWKSKRNAIPMRISTVHIVVNNTRGPSGREASVSKTALHDQAECMVWWMSLWCADEGIEV